MDRKKQICARLRVEFNTTGLVMLLYYGIMSTVTSFVVIAQMIWSMFMLGQEPSEEALLGNGWGYILSIAVGCLILLLWKKPHFCFREIWKKDRKMTVGSFFALLVLFLSGQAIFQLLIMVMEWLFNLMGLSVMDSMEMATQLGGTFSMFLYGALMAPVFEEVLFRGLILRTLEPYGKKFAILASAFLFGMFHGNIVQSPFAFFVGLVLGYVAVEYHMGWAILLHLINNLVLGDLFPRLVAPLPPAAQDLIYQVIIWGCAAAALVVCLVRRQELWGYLRSKRIHPWCMKAFFTSPTVLIFTVLMVLHMLIIFFPQLF